MADLPPLLEAQPPNGPLPENLGPELTPKRQRRPSVRLGDIGEQPAAAVSHEARRPTKQWRIPPNLAKDPAGAGRGASRTRALMTLGNGDCRDVVDGEDRVGTTEAQLDPAAVGGFRKPKEFRGKRGGGGVTKRVRSNWVPRVDEGHEGAVDKLSGEDDELRDFDVVEGSDSPLKESPLRSPDENMDLERGHDRRLVRARVTDTREPEPEPVEMEVPSEDNTDGRDWRRGASMEGNGGSERTGQGVEEGVRMWLNGLGLGRYAPVFEIHEVDEEVLPLLTLQDLKDMGINAVGSRRKMYCAIQKLARSLS